MVEYTPLTVRLYLSANYSELCRTIPPKRIQKFAQNEKNLLKSHLFKCAIYLLYKKFLSVKNYAMSADGDFCMSWNNA